VKEIYSSFSQTVEERNVVKQVITRDPNAAGLYSEDEKLALGRIFIGDISSDGYPDILLTVRYINGTNKAHVLINDPCNEQVCTVKALKAKRRQFNLEYNQYQTMLDTYDHVK
jgi:hypothetical protein